MRGMNRVSLFFVVTFLSFSAAISKTTAKDSDVFVGRVVAEWVRDKPHRTMKLTEEFEYIDPDGRHWPVPIDAIIDGASIPKVFWPIIGSPFDGAYREPSVIHDFYCDTRTRAYSDVHMMFYRAMLSAGVSEGKAWIMYKAVEKFGPHWKTVRSDPRCEVSGEEFDFDLCANNVAKPPIEWPKIDKSQVKAFVDEYRENLTNEEARAILQAAEEELH